MLADITAISHNPLVHKCTTCLCKVWVEKQKACLSTCHQALLELERENRVAVSWDVFCDYCYYTHSSKTHTRTLVPSPCTPLMIHSILFWTLNTTQITTIALLISSCWIKISHCVISLLDHLGYWYANSGVLFFSLWERK